MTLILGIAGIAFVTLSILASGSPMAYHIPAITHSGAQIHNLARGVIELERHQHTVFARDDESK